MVSVLRPGQRILSIPGYGVTTSRRAVSAGGSPFAAWCDYAWVFKGAASQAASYIDVIASLSLTEGTAPTWNSTDGLIFNGSTQYIKVGWVPGNARPSVIVRFSGAATSGTHSLIAASNGSQGVNIGQPWVGYKSLFENGGYFLDSAGAGAVSGTFAIAGQTAYVNGLSYGAISAAAGSVPELYLGARNESGTPAYFYEGNIQFLGIKTASPWDATEVAALTVAVDAL